MAKSALGRGLGALLGSGSSEPSPPAPPSSAPPPTSGSAPADGAESGIRQLPVGAIKPCPLQPRKHFEEAALKELAASIRESGIVQPLVVRAREGAWELIAGERRWRAAQIAGLTQVPVLVREADDREVLELALVENLQRENLNPLEEARGYEQLIRDFELRQEDVAVKVGKSRAAVANALRLLKLPEEIRHFIRDNRLSVGHAKVLLGLPSEEQQKLAARRILERGLSVRETEALAEQMQKPGSPRRKGAGPARIQDPHVSHLETRLQERLGSKVNLNYDKGRGSLTVKFFNDEDLERILQVLGIQLD